MKYSRPIPISEQLHKLLYKKQEELQRLLMGNVIPYLLVKEKRLELLQLESRFNDQKEFESRGSYE